MKHWKLRKIEFKLKDMKDVSEKSFSTSLSLMHSCMPRSIVLEETRKIMAWVFPWKLSRRKNCKRTTAKEVLQEELEAQNHQKPGLRGPGSRRAGISVLKTLPRTKVDSIKALKLLASPLQRHLLWLLRSLRSKGHVSHFGELSTLMHYSKWKQEQTFHIE